MHIDISAFFTSLNKDKLFGLVTRQVKNPQIRWLAEKIIFHDPTADYYLKGDLKKLAAVPPHKSLFSVPSGQGLPIGNLTSQFFANVYLNELDQFAKHHLRIKYYIRYVDDIVMLDRDPNRLKYWRNEIDNFLHHNLRLRLQPDKEMMQPVEKGINFLGYVVKPDCILVRNRTVRKCKSKLYRFNRRILARRRVHPIRSWTPELCREFRDIFASVNSYYGLFKHADTYRLRRHLYERHFGILKYYLYPADKEYSHFRWSNM
jgi:RNA-directed DNA polymerase